MERRRKSKHRRMKRGEGREGHSPFGSVQGALRWIPQVDVEVGDREGVDVVVQGGVQDSVRRSVVEGVRIPGLGVASHGPAVGQQAKGEEEVTLYLSSKSNLICFVLICYI